MMSAGDTLMGPMLFGPLASGVPPALTSVQPEYELVDMSYSLLPANVPEPVLVRPVVLSNPALLTAIGAAAAGLTENETAAVDPTTATVARTSLLRRITLLRLRPSRAARGEAPLTRAN